MGRKARTIKMDFDKEQVCDYNKSRENYYNGFVIYLEELAKQSMDAGDFSNAEKQYLMTINIYVDLTNKDPDRLIFKTNLACEYKNIGNCYFWQGETEKAKFNYIKSVEFLFSLLTKAPSGFVADFDIAGKLAESLLCYASVSVIDDDIEETDKCATYYNKTIQILKDLCIKEPKYYQRALFSTTYGIGFLYQSRNPKSTEKYYLETLKVARTLIEKDGDENARDEYFFTTMKMLEYLNEHFPDKYKYDLAISYADLGERLLSRDNNEALSFYSQAIKLLIDLEDKYNDNIDYELSDCLKHLGYILFQQGDIKNATGCYKQSISHLLKHIKEKPEMFEPMLAECFFNYGMISSEAEYVKMSAAIAEKYPDNSTCKLILKKIEELFN